MKKSTIIIIVVIALLAIWGVTGYNGLVTMDENVSGQWSNVETQYQRRADLIPNLVNTVKRYASHEKETLESVVEARSKAMHWLLLHRRKSSFQSCLYVCGDRAYR